jgi:hypothetical protein
MRFFNASLLFYDNEVDLCTSEGAGGNSSVHKHIKTHTVLLLGTVLVSPFGELFKISFLIFNVQPKYNKYMENAHKS